MDAAAAGFLPGQVKILSRLLSMGQGEGGPETAYHEGERFEEKRGQALLPPRAISEYDIHHT